MARKKLPSIRILRNRLDRAFNEYIRRRDGKCILCGTTERLVCSHYYGKKGRPILRWNEVNAHAMCVKCHWKHHHGIEGDYALFMFEKYGMTVMRNMKANSLCKPIVPNREWLEEKIDYFKSRIKAISEDK